MGIMAVGVLFVLILGGTPDVSFTAVAQVAEYVVVIMTLEGGGEYSACLSSCLHHWGSFGLPQRLSGHHL